MVEKCAWIAVSAARQVEGVPPQAHLFVQQRKAGWAGAVGGPERAGAVGRWWLRSFRWEVAVWGSIWNPILSACLGFQAAIWQDI